MHPGFGTHLLGEDSSTLSLPSGSGGLIQRNFLPSNIQPLMLMKSMINIQNFLLRNSM